MDIKDSIFKLATALEKMAAKDANNEEQVQEIDVTQSFGQAEQDKLNDKQNLVKKASANLLPQGLEILSKKVKDLKAEAPSRPSVETPESLEAIILGLTGKQTNILSSLMQVSANDLDPKELKSSVEDRVLDELISQAHLKPKQAFREALARKVSATLDTAWVESAFGLALTLGAKAFLKSSDLKTSPNINTKQAFFESILDLAAKIIAKKIIEKLRQIAVRYTKTVVPKIGSILYCDLLGLFEHTGIYIGQNKIIHRDGEGFIGIVTPEEFVARLDGLNPATNIFVACQGDEVYGEDEVAKRAKDAYTDPKFQGYNIIFRNCHQFTQYCVTNGQEEAVDDFAFSRLNTVLREMKNVDTWYQWATTI